MSAYRKLNRNEYFDVRRKWSSVNASFWHAVDDRNRPCARIKNNYRRATMTRNDDTLYFLCDGSFYVVPEDEYKFIEGDVNTKLSDMDFHEKERYYDAMTVYKAALVRGTETQRELALCKLVDACTKKFARRLYVGADARWPSQNAAKRHEAHDASTHVLVSAPKAENVAPKHANVANEPEKDTPKPKKSAPKPKKRTYKRKATTKKQPEKTVVAEDKPHQDTSGWKGTRKRRSCVSKRNTHDAAVGCMAIGAMFARKG